ncbi:MAG: UbiA family prenyltransferase [Deltaproteobacteria bacterium]|nr:UbiA family prenyltransferase [Deltaproteobacteria bacterium]
MGFFHSFFHPVPDTGFSPLIRRVRTYGRLIKFSHTLFALPFALAAVLLAHRSHSVTWPVLFWILVAMASARSAAMGFNRYADFEFDRRNPRTSGRPLVQGQISKNAVLVFIAASSLIFLLSAAALNPLCFVLSGPVLVVLFFYSYTKRFTAYSHLILGFAIGLAPAGAWIAATGSLDPRICLLSFALMTYIAGFDILYACQDVEFDRQEKLHSLPASRGIRKALAISAMLHVGTFLLLVAVHVAFHLGPLYLFFTCIISALLLVEHLLVRPDNLANVNVAFFHVNSAISILLFLGVLADTWFS